MDGGVFKVLLLAGRLNRHHGGWPLSGLLDRLGKRSSHVQVLCLSRGGDLTNDPRAVELPALGNRWLREFVLRGLWSHDRLERPDLIHVLDDDMADTALPLAESARLPYIQTVSRFETVARGLRLSRRWCRGLVATSPDLARALVEELGVPDDRIAVIPPGLCPSSLQAHQLQTGKVPVIGTGGLLEEASGMETFLEAARRVVDAGYDVEFVIASHGSQQVVLRHRAQRYRLAERLTVADYPSFGAEFWIVLDIYCQPAVVASTGRTLIQALGHAIPCIATGVPGLRALIDPGENGILVPRADPVALSNAIIDLLDHPELARRLGASALSRTRAVFDPDVEASRLAELYRQAAGTTACFGGDG